MIAISPRPAGYDWNTVSFPSTLYLIPILDLLMSKVPTRWQAEVRLGLQEALVNAAKHGNKLDPGKKILIQFSMAADQYWWIISDQGSGFQAPACDADEDQHLPAHEGECGRGLYILYQVFDHVQWNSRGTELRLCKHVRNSSRLPLVI